MNSACASAGHGGVADSRWYLSPLSRTGFVMLSKVVLCQLLCLQCFSNVSNVGWCVSCFPVTGFMKPDVRNSFWNNNVMLTMLASTAYISFTHERWPEPEPDAGFAPGVRVHPHHLLILLSSRGRHHGLSHRQFGGLAQTRRQVLARYNGRSSADDWQTQLGPKLSNSQLVAFLAQANQKTFTSLPPFFLLGNAGGQAPRKPSTRHLPDTAPPSQVLSSATSSRRRGAASLRFFCPSYRMSMKSVGLPAMVRHHRQ